MNNHTLEKSTAKLLEILKQNRTTVKKETDALRIKQPSKKEIVISDRPVQIDSTELI